jgi:quercetin dioxygenase-like cupin family protein
MKIAVIGGSGLIALLVAISSGSAFAETPGSKNARVTLVYEHALPDMPGKSLKGVLVEYGPGGYSPPHTHPKSALIYATVLEGAVKMQINQGPAHIYKAGENFTEMPNDHHGLSANASETEPAKMLAVFVVNTDEMELVTPDSK